MSETNVVRPGTLVKAIVGLVKATGNFNHFLATPQGTKDMVKHMNDTRKWWPEYTTYFTDARIRIMLAAYVVLKHCPDIAKTYPEKLGKSKVAGDVLSSCIARMGEGVSDEDAIPPNIKDVWNTQAYWEEAVKFADRMGSKRNEAYNLDVERKKNPGHFKVGKNWVPYGAVFHDEDGQEVVATNHAIMPKALVEIRGQGLENALAVMPLEKAQPAINRINELGGSMFAAICRAGLAEIEQLVADCGEVDPVKAVRELATKNAMEASGGRESADGFAPISQVVPIDDLTDEQLDTIKSKWACAEGKDRRESFKELFAARGATLQWIAQVKPDVKALVSSGVLKLQDVAGVQLVMVLPANFYDGCTKIDHDMDDIPGQNNWIVKEVDGVTYMPWQTDPKLAAKERAKSGWLDPWDVNNPYRADAVMFVTWSEVNLLDSKPETRALCRRHYHESSIDDGELHPATDGRFPQFARYVIIRPESPEKYKAICDRLRPIRRAMAMLSKPADPYWPKEQQLKHWVDLGFTEGEALDLHLRSRTLRGVNKLITTHELSNEKVGEVIGCAGHAVEDMRKGFIEMFELDELTEIDEKLRQLINEPNQEK